MKKILVSSILAATACLSIVGQANAAPSYDQHHKVQVQHQKHDNKASNSHKHAKAKAAKSHHKANVVAAKHEVKEKQQNKYQGKYQGKKQIRNDHQHRS
ncbi:hypothetical protein ACQKCF_05855 [Psychrobacter proteolyticus]|uniref:hypothetical protein n=1 Tax=Psychrobacter proteolyticus TaxID=147825 RepID=UPI003D05A4F3